MVRSEVRSYRTLPLSEHTKVHGNVREKTIVKQVTEFCYNWPILLVVTYCADLYTKCIISTGKKNCIWFVMLSNHGLITAMISDTLQGILEATPTTKREPLDYKWVSMSLSLYAK